MANDWILDVLADLRDFASKNGLGLSEQHLNRTLVAVANDLASVQGVAQGTARSMSHVGEFSGTVAGGRVPQGSGRSHTVVEQ